MIYFSLSAPLGQNALPSQGCAAGQAALLQAPCITCCLCVLCCRLLCVFLRHHGCADGDGESVSLPARTASPLGGVPEQILPWRRLSVYTLQLPAPGVMHASAKPTRMKSTAAAASSRIATYCHGWLPGGGPGFGHLNPWCLLLLQGLGSHQAAGLRMPCNDLVQALHAVALLGMLSWSTPPAYLVVAHAHAVLHMLNTCRHCSTW